MILVTGATTGTGRSLIDVLTSDGADVRAATRHPRTPGPPARVEVVKGDRSGPDTLTPALHGVTGPFLHPRTTTEVAAELLTVAQEQGAWRVMALLAMNIDNLLDEQPCRYRGDRNEAEEAAVVSSLEWASLRASSLAIARPLRLQTIPPDVAKQGMIARGSPSPSSRP